MKALLLIGLQVDLLPGGGAQVIGSEPLSTIASRLMEQYELIVAANFWHPVDHQFFAANHLWRKPGQAMEVGGELTELRSFYCIQNSFGAEFLPGIDATKIDFIAHMGTQALQLPYSAFFDSKKTNPTGLANFLKEKEVSELHLAGMPLETAVKHSALDALEAGFEVTLLQNAIRGREDESGKNALTSLEQAGVKFLAKQVG